MKRYGFEVIRMWETRHSDRTEFVYLLQWPSEAVMKDRWTAYPRRRRMVADQARDGRRAWAIGRRD